MDAQPARDAGAKTAHLRRVRACTKWLVAVAAAAGLQTAAAQGAAAQGARAPAAADAAVAACAGCHGARGEGLGDFPRLAGFGASYLRAQLEAFAAGTRKSPVMQPIAQALNPQQQMAAAQYFSALPPPATRREEPAASPNDAGAWLATRGRWEASVPACAQCHGPGGIGVGEHFPPLAGQPAAYLAGQLKAWQAGARPPGPLGLMAAIAQKLNDAEIRTVSDYYAQLALPAGGAARTARTKP